MTRLMRAEVVKLTTTRLAYALLFAVIGLTALATLISLVQDGAGTLRSMSGAGGLAKAMGNMSMFAVLPLILGLTALPGELRHGTIVLALLAQPRRGRLLMAKAVTYGAAGGLMMLAAIGVLVALASIWAVALGVQAPLIDASAAYVALRLAVASASLCLLGLGIGAIVRNQVAAVTAGLIWALVVEQLAGGVLPSLAKWLPFTSSTIFELGSRSVSLGKDLPQWWVAGLVLAAYAALACVTGTVVLQRHDVA
jgi:ABC-2 type transport system permease protein